MTVAESNGRSAIVRNIDVAAAAEPLWLMLGFTSTAGSMSLCRGTQAGLALESIPTGGAADAPAWAVKIPSHTEPVQLCVAMSDGALAENVAFQAIPAGAAAQRWPQKVTTTVTRSTAKDAYVVDDFALPVDNPWRRNVRPGDIQFFKDGTGVSVTLDGDVWLVRGLQLPNGPVTWTRFASGLHEPMSVAIRDDELHVFDRNGIWRLRDTNGDGEADVHELFSNAFAQTADNREFPSTLRLAPGGEFVIAKGGQEAATIGKHNGSVLKVSADGRTRHGPRLRLPSAADRRQRPDRTRHRERSAGPLHSVDSTPHRQGPPVLWLPQRQAAARGLSGARLRSRSPGFRMR